MIKQKFEEEFRMQKEIVQWVKGNHGHLATPVVNDKIKQGGKIYAI